MRRTLTNERTRRTLKVVSFARMTLMLLRISVIALAPCFMDPVRLISALGDVSGAGGTHVANPSIGEVSLGASLSMGLPATWTTTA